jgi:hypothetical protein
MAGKVADYQAALTENVEARFVGLGLDPADSGLMAEWIENGGQLLKGQRADAIREITRSGSTTGFTDMAKQYIGQLDATQPDRIMEVCASKGWPAYQSGTKILIDTPQGRMAWKQAADLGILRLKG